jgi:hypothetical protein
MKKIIHIGALSLLFALGVSMISSPVVAAEAGGGLANDGFVPLFNGTNWNGWYFKIKSGDAGMAKRVYTIEDGMVHVFRDLPDGYQLNLGSNDTHGLFYTEKKFSQYILKFDYKWGAKKFNNFNEYQYDAGCNYHVVNDKIWPTGIEYQVRYNHLKNKNHTGDFWAYGLEWYCGTNNRFLLPQDGGTLTLGHSGEHLARATDNFHALDDRWNECEVIVMADKYAIHKLNGQVVNYATKLPYHEGNIGLQSETAEIFYRNIRIKEFAEVVPAEQFLKKTVHDLAYPHQFKFEGNPLSRLHSATDPDVQVWDGVVWMYCSQDRNMKSGVHQHHYDAMDGYHAFSSPDMVNWTDHGEVMHSKNVSWGKDGWLWAPGSARKDGKYFLYYPHQDTTGTWRIGVAMGDSPTGPFKDSGKPIEGITGIDPKIFIDDDGEAYIYNNNGVVARLKPNLIELAEQPRKIVYASPEIMNDENLKFLEGSYLHKKDGVYYYSYSNWKNKEHQGFYAMGKSPYGPFEWKGPMAPHPEGAQDHHSIIEFQGNWYYFYHIAVSTFPLYKEQQGRIACFDRLYYNDDGTIKMVEHTRDASK